MRWSIKIKSYRRKLFEKIGESDNVFTPFAHTQPPCDIKNRMQLTITLKDYNKFK